MKKFYKYEEKVIEGLSADDSEESGELVELEEGEL